MLEATIVIQVLLDKSGEAIIIAALLLFNAVVSFIEEGRANKALALLRSRLSTRARVLRDGVWQSLPAADLVPGDSVHLRMGDLSPADIRIADGNVLLDQSSLTGESVPVEADAGPLLTRPPLSGVAKRRARSWRADNALTSARPPNW